MVDGSITGMLVGRGHRADGEIAYRDGATSIDSKARSRELLA